MLCPVSFTKEHITSAVFMADISEIGSVAVKIAELTDRKKQIEYKIDAATSRLKEPK